MALRRHGIRRGLTVVELLTVVAVVAITDSAHFGALLIGLLGSHVIYLAVELLSLRSVTSTPVGANT